MDGSSRSVIRHRDLEGQAIQSWDRYPLPLPSPCEDVPMAVSSVEKLWGHAPCARSDQTSIPSPEKVAEDIDNIEHYIQCAHLCGRDIRQHGRDYAERFFKECRRWILTVSHRARIDSPGALLLPGGQPDVLQIFYQFSPDSHDEKVRHA